MFVLGSIKALTFGKQGNKKKANSLGFKIAVEWHKTSANLQISSRSPSSQFRDWLEGWIFYYQVGTWITFVKFQFHKTPKVAEITSAQVQLNDPLGVFYLNFDTKNWYQRSGIPKHTSNPRSDDPFDSARIVSLSTPHRHGRWGKATFGTRNIAASLWS